MALKLRRGTEANRTSITPAEGELIYVTDTKKLYSGDGTTAGGVLVTSDSAAIPGIDDNTTAGAVLTLGDLVIAIDADLSITGYEINGDGDIDITGNITASGAGTGIITASSFVGDVTGNVIGNASGAHTGTLDGDMTGSVFADDSSIIIDAVNNTINTSTIQATNNILKITAQTSGAENSARIIGDEASTSFRFQRSSSSALAGTTDILGQINWERNGSDGLQSTILQLGYPNSWLLAVDDSGTFATDKFIAFTDSKFGIGITSPTSTLDVVGDIKIGSFTTAERDALTGANGMMLYNSTTNQLESYENGAWGATGGAGGGSIGNFTFASSVVDTDDSSGIVITPAVTMSSDLTVENDLVVSNTVTAGKFVSTGTETPEISASANLNLTAGNAVVITSSPLRMASFTTTERNALAAQNGDIIYNTTDNKFQGYENGAWANLI